MASRDPQRPNVLFILSDDQGAWSLGCAGNRDARTPTLDRIAAQGIRFTNFFCASPVCSPARASLLTGEIPSQHGVHDWIRAGNVGAERVDYLASHTLLTDIVAAEGYRCALIGKWHLGASDVPRRGFVKWFAHQSGMSAYYDAPMVDETEVCTVHEYLTDKLTALAIEQVREEAGRAEPFWLSLNYTAPHYPWIDSHPAAYTDLFKDCAFESCPQGTPHPYSASGNPATDQGHARPRESLIGYFASVTAMDAGIARVLDELERCDLLESTLIVFMSDNGMNCGHHGIWGKGNGTRPQNMYDTSVKVPCLFAQPGRIPAGRVSDDLVSAYDFFPTLVEYLALPHRESRSKPGASFASILRGDRAARQDQVVVYDEYGPVRMVRTHDWKYVHRYPDGPHELYALTLDPGERSNLVERPEHAATVADMRRRLERWFARFVDPALDGAYKSVTGCGQLGRITGGPHDSDMFAETPIQALSAVRASVR